MADLERRYGARYLPLVRNVWLRGAVGVVLLLASFVAAAVSLGRGQLEVLIPGSALAWAVAAYLTHKYIHKYPRRYATYLVASHLKAALVMAVLLAVFGWAAGPAAAPWVVVWVGFALFVVVDFFVSALRRKEAEDPSPGRVTLSAGAREAPTALAASPSSINKQAVLNHIRPDLPDPIVEFVERNLPDAHGVNSDALIVDRPARAGEPATAGPAGLVVGRTRLNDIHRLSDFLLFCARSTAMQGYVVVRYLPLEGAAGRLRERYGRALYGPASVLHFLWYQAIPKAPLLDTIQSLITRKGNRALSKAEVWGRLAYCGLRVLAESSGKGECYVIAQRDALPVQGKKPSYYPVIALEKVGLDGKVMHLHKLRSMFPYSEFLQKRIYEEHGLTSTGKFANDFRITRFGRFVRKYWLDELPQLFDWLRGDIKLVGMRATSPHYLGLYPKEIMDLYVQVKPGFVSPIFDESPKGFDQFVEVEGTYLKRYLAAPIRTDIAYFYRTWTDIFCRGVRGR